MAQAQPHFSLRPSTHSRELVLVFQPHFSPPPQTGGGGESPKPQCTIWLMGKKRSQKQLYVLPFPLPKLEELQCMDALSGDFPRCSHWLDSNGNSMVPRSGRACDDK